jgi:hypothetical protein
LYFTTGITLFGTKFTVVGFPSESLADLLTPNRIKHSTTSDQSESLWGNSRANNTLCDLRRFYNKHHLDILLSTVQTATPYKNRLFPIKALTGSYPEVSSYRS